MDPFQSAIDSKCQILSRNSLKTTLQKNADPFLDRPLHYFGLGQPAQHRAQQAMMDIHSLHLW
jgi:hypothetical protein